MQTKANQKLWRPVSICLCGREERGCHKRSGIISRDERVGRYEMEEEKERKERKKRTEKREREKEEKERKERKRKGDAPI